MNRSQIAPGIFAVIAIVLVTVILRLGRSELVLLIGLTCGFIFSLPALLLIFVAWRRRERQIGTQGQYHALERHQPPVVIVPPVTSPQLPHYQPQHWSEADDLPLLPNKREFTVIGEED